MRYLVLFLLSLMIGLPGKAGIPPVDRDESRYVQATKQMVETGDYVDIRFQEESRYKKPVGIYWMQAAVLAIGGQGAESPLWIYRIVSVLGAAFAALATCWAGTALFGRPAGFAAGAIMAALFGLVFEAHIAKTDAVLAALTIAAQGALAQIYVASRTERLPPVHLSWVFWLAQGAGVLVKGPIVPLASVLTIAALFAFDRNVRWLRDLRPVRGVVLAGVMVLPWLLLITWKSGGAFWIESVGQDMLGKVGGGAESHGAPPGYYLLTYGVFTWPFGVFALLAGLVALNRARDDARLLFLLCWYVPFWFFFELIPTKLPHYVLPAYPALALLAGWALAQSQPITVSGLRLWQKWLLYPAYVGHIVVTVALAGAAIAGPIYLGGGFNPFGIVAAIAIVGTGFLAIAHLSGITIRRAGYVAVASIVAYGSMFGLVLPSFDRMWMAPRIAAAFEEHRPCPQSVLASVGFHEPSLVFLAGTDTVLTDVNGAAEHLLDDPACAVAVVPAKDVNELRGLLSAEGANVDEVAAIDGVNYSKGQRLSLRMVRSAAE
ncbi:ArnT family glycosyltransferase [Oricola cellulosilytica]|uniref:Glycosyltransferase family 39 protein n=1 Tax=Oricola cellulosilytica TaxID=1429082 RepID=A0A4R0P8S5_9HYPH|nr:glycosyltransferase family 39 protein [Oricola cellulosilytica]TCD12406.1 glycosyltransferase family 39 protein [Oricola cellulosilytica]